jgi:hypothetical protein
MYNESFQLVDLIGSDGRLAPGLVPIKEKGTKLRVDEQAAVLTAKFFEHIDYIFFRRFYDGRSSQVSAYVVDNSDERLDEKALAELHRQVWLYGMAPLLYVAWPGRIDLLTCARGPDFWEQEGKRCSYRPADVVRTVGSITKELHRYSVLRLADGTFWEEHSNWELANYEKAAHQLLIQAIVEADSAIEGAKNPILRRLLLLMVLIRYLEDRGVFPENWFSEFHKGAKTFFEVLKGGNPEKVYRLLSSLEDKFNGDMFSLPGKRGQLTNTVLSKFADLVSAKTLNRQQYLWAQFSFKHLPVEIISHLYQRFVQAGHGAIYTPPFLASLLLDHAMPYNELTGNERILDPACGSGVFLVGAFRRLVNIWRSKNNWRRPSVDVLKKQAQQSIFGIEIDSDAIDLSGFSLSLAICDALQPEIIWQDLRFDPFRNSNLFERDFFQVLLDSKDKSPLFDKGFDVIIGNPPFKSELSAAAKKIDDIAQHNDPRRGTLPDKQIAYLFLEQALTILRSNGRVCLIQPSGFLYNRKVKNFRKAFLRKNKVDTIFDFTSIRKLYKADPKTVAVLAYSVAPSEDHRIKHWSFRRTVSVKERICFELDHYDRYRISQGQAETNLNIWRINLLGGGRLTELSKRLENLRTLAEYVSQKGWDYGEGFIVAKGGIRTPAPFLTGKPLLPTEAFTDEGIDESRIKTVKETLFRSSYTESRFTAPLVLIKETDSLPIEFWDKGFLAYRHKIVGIHAPPSQISELRDLYNAFRENHNICRLACILNGTQSLVGKATAILKQDIDALPHPDDLKHFSFSFWETALCNDVLEYMTEYIRLGQNSDLLKNTAGVDDLRKYSDLFIHMLGSVYDNLNASDPIFLNGLTCQQFYFGECQDKFLLENQSGEDLRKLIYDTENHSHLRTTRILRLYSENFLLLVKPDRLRYWISSMAIRDADETLIDLSYQGY